MMTIQQYITHVYPRKTLEEQQLLVDVCAEIQPYDEILWPSVTKEQLPDESVQLRLVRTLYNLQLGDERATALMVLDSLMQWSDNQDMNFSSLSEDAVIFYQHFFVLLAFLHFDVIGPRLQVFLLGSKFLILACFMDVAVYSSVQPHFASLLWVQNMKEDAILFASAIASNDTVIGTEGKSVYSVAQWVNTFNNFFGSSVTAKVDEFMRSKMEANRLDEGDKSVLWKILSLYYGLQSGLLWKEIEAEDVVVPHSRTLTSQGKTADDYYLELFEQGDPAQLTSWLSDWQNTVAWIYETEKERGFINRMFYILTKKANLTDEEQTGYLLEFMNGLSQIGWVIESDLLILDESTGKFQWNTEVVNMLKEEADYYDKQRVKDRLKLQSESESAPAPAPNL